MSPAATSSANGAGVPKRGTIPATNLGTCSNGDQTVTIDPVLR